MLSCIPNQSVFIRASSSSFSPPTVSSLTDFPSRKSEFSALGQSNPSSSSFYLLRKSRIHQFIPLPETSPPVILHSPSPNSAQTRGLSAIHFLKPPKFTSLPRTLIHSQMVTTTKRDWLCIPQSPHRKPRTPDDFRRLSSAKPRRCSMLV